MTTHAITPTGVKLEPKIKSRLKSLAKLQHRTIHWLMKHAILLYIENEEQQEKLRQETLARWEEVEQNKIVSNESIMAWLDTWGTDDETGRPPCEK